MDNLCYLCIVFVMLSRLFIAALWSSTGKGRPVIFDCVLSLSHVVSWVRCDTGLYRFLIFTDFLTITIYTTYTGVVLAQIRDSWCLSC